MEVIIRSRSVNIPLLSYQTVLIETHLNARPRYMKRPNYILQTCRNVDHGINRKNSKTKGKRNVLHVNVTKKSEPVQRKGIDV